MPGGYAVAALFAGVLLLWIGIGLLMRRIDPEGARPASTLRVVLGGAVGLALISLAPVAPQPVYALIAGVAALTATAAIGGRLQAGGGFAGPSYRVPALTPAEPGTPGSLSAVAATCGVLAALATVMLAFRLRLLGPSDPALVFLAALAGMLLECWFDGAFSRRAASRPLGAALAGLMAMLLAIALP